MGFGNRESFELIQRAAKLLQGSTIVPAAYRGNLSDCVVALNMANRMDADPLMVMQNLVIVHGQPTWSAKFLISTVNACGRFSSLRYEFFGEKDTDSWGCRAWAIEKATGEKLVGTDITIDLAKKEGWYGRNGSKWKTMPQQMLMYRSAAWWVRAYAPELSMGLHTSDEMADVININEDGSFSVTTETLRSGISQPAEVVNPAGETERAAPATKKRETKQTSQAQATTADPDTGEIKPTQPELVSAHEFTFAQVNDMLVKAKSMQELDDAGDKIRYVPDSTHQEELRKVYHSKRSMVF